MSYATPILPSGALGHVPEMTGHVAEIAGHDPETAGHVRPKYASKWLRDVANQRVHPVTGQAPAILLEQRERACLLDMPGYTLPRLPARAVARPRVDPAMSIQHPLSVYQQLLTEVRA
ncbi:hypothetical protein LGM31_35140, partial [Burkholderia vietnamiensis]|nr:hypothetical protein [Burkholderia vietnamiensis]